MINLSQPTEIQKLGGHLVLANVGGLVLVGELQWRTQRNREHSEHAGDLFLAKVVEGERLL